jgi:PAS domain S-box-containing protein
MHLAQGLDFKRLFESAPGLYLILSRELNIVAVSDDYLRATMTSREEIIGRGLFDVFPDNPDDPAATGVSNLRASLNYVLQNRESHTMAVQRYDIRRPDGSFEERYWSPCNKPVIDNSNEISCIIHRVEDVTAFVHLKNEEAKSLKLTESLRGQVQKMEMEIYQRAQEIQEINRKLLIEIQEREKVESQMRDTEEQIKESQLMFSTIFYEGPVMNTITDVNTGKYIEVNDNFARFCGMAKKDIIGRTSLELNLIADAKYRSDLISEIKLKGFARDVLVEVTSNDGGSRWISTSVHMSILMEGTVFLRR